MDVIFKEGMLFLQGAKFGKKTWRRIWMMLFKASSTGVGRFEIFTVLDNSNGSASKRKVVRQKSAERKVVRLSDCLSVMDAPKESCPAGCTAFYLNTTQSIYTLASTCSQEWLSALSLLAFQKDPGEADKGGFERGNGVTMEDNDLYSSWERGPTLPPNQYRVTVKSTEASRSCQLSGQYVISHEKEAVKLLAISTSHVIYCWPYKLLRKFGQVEGGFSIEAGRRCESGEGLFIFLSQHGPQIFQAILKQCCADRSSTSPSTQSLSSHRRSLSDQSLPTTTTSPPVHIPAADTEDQSADHYSTINYIPKLNKKRLSLIQPYLCNRQDELDEDERCHSLDALDLDRITGDEDIYYNVKRATPPTIKKDQFKVDSDDSESIYSHVNKIMDSPLNPWLQPYSPSIPQAPPCPNPLPQYVPPSACPTKAPRYHQRQPPANSLIQPGYNAQARAQAVDDMKETEEASSSSSSACVAPSQALGSFKQRLAELISKDLAKLQQPPALPPAAGSPTFFSQ